MPRNNRTFRISDNQFEMLKTLAEKTNKSQARVVEDMITAFYGLINGNQDVFNGFGKVYEELVILSKNNKK